jgi:uncharacterized protein
LSVLRGFVADVAVGLDSAGDDLRQAATEGWTLLSELDAERPEIVREVLTYPFVQAWAMRCLSPASSPDPDLDRAHMAGLAAAAALRAGMEVDVVLPVRDGSIFVPAVGAFDVGAGTRRTAEVRVSPSGLSLLDHGGGWKAVRSIKAGHISVTVEDLDPFRDCRAWAATGRLTTPEWEEWRLALTVAASRLAAELPAYVGAIGTGLRAVVPMRPGPPGHHQSGTARQAFGAVALALTDDADMLSELLVHEMQHVKLTALSDLFDLFDRANGDTFRVGWRRDPRPVEGVLHGTYAYLGIADLWRSRSMLRSDGETRGRFLAYRSWVEEAIETLMNTGALLPDGRRFVNSMRSTVEAWADDK